MATSVDQETLKALFVLQQIILAEEFEWGEKMANLSRNTIITFAILKMETNEMIKAGNSLFY